MIDDPGCQLDVIGEHQRSIDRDAVQIAGTTVCPAMVLAAMVLAAMVLDCRVFAMSRLSVFAFRIHQHTKCNLPVYIFIAPPFGADCNKRCQLVI